MQEVSTSKELHTIAVACTDCFCEEPTKTICGHVYRPGTGCRSTYMCEKFQECIKNKNSK